MLEGKVIVGTRTKTRGGVNEQSYKTPFEQLAASKETRYAIARKSLSDVIYTLGVLRPSTFIPVPESRVVSGNVAVDTSSVSQSF